MVGLSQNFIIVNGRFNLTANQAKAKDNLNFFMQFNFVRRIYLSDFTPDILWVLQKPFSTVLSLKTALLGSLQKKLTLYVPAIEVQSLDTLYDRENKQYAIFVNYRYSDEDSEIQSNVTFI